MKNTGKINDFDVLQIHKAFITYRGVLKKLQNAFTLGEFAKAARKQFSLRDEVGKEIHEALRRNKDEVVVFE